MSNGMTTEDEKSVVGFRAVVHVIKPLEKSNMIKVFEYRPSKNFSHHTPVLIDQVIAENLTVAGESELQRLIELLKDPSKCI